MKFKKSILALGVASSLLILGGAPAHAAFKEDSRLDTSRVCRSYPVYLGGLPGHYVMHKSCG